VERLILRRLLLVPPTLLAVVTIAFVMMRAAPGGPFDLERPLDPATMENLKRVFGLDEPLWRQYLDYLGALAWGDLGPSYGWREYSVGELLGHALPISFGLGASALILALFIGVAAGAAAAERREAHSTASLPPRRASASSRRVSSSRRSHK